MHSDNFDREKPYKHLCAFELGGNVRINALYDGRIITETKDPDVPAVNQNNYSAKDLASINEATELFKRGELCNPDCDTCEHRFLCWTNK